MSVRHTALQEQQPKRRNRSLTRVIIILMAILFLCAAGLFWILNIGRVISGEWSNILPIVFVVLGVIFTLLQWLAPLQPIGTQFSPPPTVQLTAGLSSDTGKEQKAIWNVPYRRNVLFTGREDLLTILHNHLSTNKASALTQAQAIKGLGGIGKTQIAVEYAYLHIQEYNAILWANAATSETLLADIIAFARVFNLPEQHEQDQTITLAAVQHWFNNHTKWLLILDNVDDLSFASSFFPTGENGYILLTTRQQASGTIANDIEVGTMGQNEGALLLLRRAKVLAPHASIDHATLQDQALALAIVTALDGLPLALDQAGAYIEETGCTLSTYLQHYQHRQADMLRRRGQTGTEYPQSVATTWSLSFEKVEQQSQIAADLLQLCAFLSPDAIPEEVLINGAGELGSNLQSLITDPSKLDEALAVLRLYSLIKRNPFERTLSLHRLIQAVIKAEMSQEAHKQWAERIVRAVNHTFPNVNVNTWPQCLRLLSQAQVCADLIDEYTFTFPEAAYLLNRAARYFYDHAFYEQAKPFFQRALTIMEHSLGSEHPDTATSLNNMATLYRVLGKYEQAEPLFQRALAIREHTLGSEHPDTATSLNNMALLYQDQGKYEQAKLLFQHALTIRERTLGSEHPDTATSLNNIAGLYQDEEIYEQAKPLFQRALSITENALGSNHPATATCLNNLARLYYDQGKYEQAEPLFQRALTIREHTLGSDHPATATCLNNLARLYQGQGKYEQAEPLFQRTLSIREHTLGSDHPATATCLDNLAGLYHDQGKYEQAKPLYQRALIIMENTFGSENIVTANNLNNLAGLYRDQGEYEQAKPLYQRVLTITEHIFGSEHSKTKAVHENYNNFLKEMKQV